LREAAARRPKEPLMDLAAIVLIQILYAIASLIVISSGLAVIFGMMKVINLAHGEFMMLGAYATIEAMRLGINLWVAIFVVAPVTVGLIGIVLERVFIRRLYGRMIDTMRRLPAIRPLECRPRLATLRSALTRSAAIRS
jgi:branched-subunit amino acid ABC-type transport system permease component